MAIIEGISGRLALITPLARFGMWGIGIILTIPTRRRAPWQVHFHRQEAIRSLELGR